MQCYLACDGGNTASRHAIVASGGTYINGGVLQFANANAVPNPGNPYGQIYINSGGGLSAISGDATDVNDWLNAGDIAGVPRPAQSR